MLEELPAYRPDPAPRSGIVLRVLGLGTVALVVGSVLSERPRPALQGRGLAVSVALVLFVGSIPWMVSRRTLAPGRRLGAVLGVLVASLVLLALQPGGFALAGVFLAVIMTALRLPDRVGWPVAGAGVIGAIAVVALTAASPGGSIIGFLASIAPWWIVVRLMRDDRQRRHEAEQLVDELRQSRAAHAEAAALAERSRVARDMHDVLAHSLSALAIQLEATRLLAADPGAERAVLVRATERAHQLAVEGLREARDAVGALRGDELPGPERLHQLTEDFTSRTATAARFSVSGPARPLPAEVRNAIYRTAQEALTNVTRHSEADRVEVRLRYEPDRVVLAVEDHRAGSAPTCAGTGGGYGLTGMSERAELLDGQLVAGPTADGFRVELTVPA